MTNGFYANGPFYVEWTSGIANQNMCIVDASSSLHIELFRDMQPQNI